MPLLKAGVAGAQRRGRILFVGTGGGIDAAKIIIIII